MKTVDTNILVYAHREEFPQHAVALKTLTTIATAVDPWVLLWPCLYEFVRIVTHPKVFDPPTPLDDAVAAAEGLLASPSVITVSEGSRHPIWFARTLSVGGATGNLAFDAHIAALMREHAIDEIVTADRDFHRFPGLRISNPFQDPAR